MYVNKSIVKGLMIKQKLKNINIAKRTIFFLGVFVGYAQNVQMIFYWKEFFCPHVLHSRDENFGCFTSEVIIFSN